MGSYPMVRLRSMVPFIALPSELILDMMKIWCHQVRGDPTTDPKPSQGDGKDGQT